MSRHQIEQSAADPIADLIVASRELIATMRSALDALEQIARDDANGKPLLHAMADCLAELEDAR